MTIYQEVLKTIKPSGEEIQHFKQVTTSFLEKLNKNLKDAKAVVGGSGSRDTWLSGNHDVDVFVLFNYKQYANKSSSLSEILAPIVKKSFPKLTIERLHGSRDYFQLQFQNIEFEVIPILSITKAAQACNITDVSPLHAKWVNAHTKKLKDEVRIAKQFFKANKLYGAESYIAGFSGYMVEVLVAFYGSFEKLLQTTQKWKKKQIIDVSKFYPKGDALFHLNKSKTVSPLVLIDPVDKNRNAAAALSEQKYKALIKTAKAYLAKPSVSFFEQEDVSFTTLSKQLKKNQHLVYLTVTSLKGKEDVVGVKLVKSFNHIRKELAPFTVLKADWSWQPGEKAIFYYITKTSERPSEEIRQGPPLELKEHVKQFKKKNKNTFTKGKHIMARVTVEHPQLANAIVAIIKRPYVRERVKTIAKPKFS